MWKFLQHPNVLPLVGVMMSEARFAMVSRWMENGNINEFIKANPEADRLELVGPPLQHHCPRLVTIGDPLAGGRC